MTDAEIVIVVLGFAYVVIMVSSRIAIEQRDRRIIELRQLLRARNQENKSQAQQQQE